MEGMQVENEGVKVSLLADDLKEYISDPKTTPGNFYGW